MKLLPSAWATAAALCAAATVSPLRAAHAQSAAGGTGDGIAAPAVEAQQPAAPRTAVAGPTLASASVAVRASGAEEQQRLAAAASAVPTNALPAQRHSQGQPKALMIVGGAAFIAGALIGDTAGTAIMIGGAGVGLYGLYLYLQ
jgi:hypothetical protein